jgi:hypothetical protein
MKLAVTNGKGCGCALLGLVLLCMTAGCLVVMRMRAGADVAAVKGEPPEVSIQAIKAVMPPESTNEVEVHK